MSREDGLSHQQRDRTDASARQERAVGRIATLILVPSAVAVPLGPAWAVLSGVIAGGQWRWEGSFFLSLVMVAFITEILWSSWRAQLVDAGWKEWIQSHPLPATGASVPIFLYTRPDSPLGRSLSYIGRIRLWIDEVLPGERRGALIAALVLPPLVLILSILISVDMLVLSAAAMSLVLLEWRLAARGARHDAPRAALEVGFSWLAGHLVAAPLTPLSLTLAACYATAYQGILRAERSLTGTDRLSAWAVALLIGGQLAAGLVVLLFGQAAPRPGAIALAFLVIPQLLLLVGGSLPGQSQQYARRVAPFLMVAMPIAAWAAS